MALAMYLPVFAQDAQTKKVAILETVDKENAISYGVKLMVRSKLAYAITNTPGYEAYDRVNISSIMNEQEFQRTGMVSDDEIKRLGVMTGADYVVIAEAATLDRSHIMLYTTILSVETARVVQTSNIQTATEIDSMEKACQELASRLLGVRQGRTVAPSVPGTAGKSSSGYGNAGQSSAVRDFVETAVGLNMKMVYVEGGSFLMGATSEQGSDVFDDERAIRRVSLDSYYIGECEVTQSQWSKVMGTSVSQQAGKVGHSADEGVGPDYPMYYVSWEEAQAFCRELSLLTGRTYCLPTEAQWEYAARGGKNNDGTKYSGSWSADAVAWYENNSSSSTHPVKTKRPNSLGLYDMSGNVWEWCFDWYGSSYNVNETSNPVGPSTGSYRVLRGGSWFSSARGCRVSFRRYDSSGSRNNSYGFRVVVLP